MANSKIMKSLVLGFITISDGLLFFPSIHAQQKPQTRRDANYKAADEAQQAGYHRILRTRALALNRTNKATVNKPPVPKPNSQLAMASMRQSGVTDEFT